MCVVISGSDCPADCDPHFSLRPVTLLLPTVIVFVPRARITKFEFVYKHQLVLPVNHKHRHTCIGTYHWLRRLVRDLPQALSLIHI